MWEKFSLITKKKKNMKMNNISGKILNDIEDHRTEILFRILYEYNTFEKGFVQNDLKKNKFQYLKINKDIKT